MSRFFDLASVDAVKRQLKEAPCAAISDFDMFSQLQNKEVAQDL